MQEQQQLTAVEQFSQWHDNEHKGEADRAPARSYSSLIPTGIPGEGRQYGFEVDLDACSGCKACVTACHSLNGLDENETWRDVGLLLGGTAERPVMQHVTTACHHCLEPACMTACPVDAYEKDPLTGIVKHLDDQCFGCQYCTLACPYDVPKYNPSLGIVRKCDLCSSRLAAGEAPACVQGCPTQAISVRIVSQRQVVEDCETNQFLPGAPQPDITLPATTYKTERPLPRNMLPADYFSVQAQHPHWPLLLMLVLTQLSVGAFLVQMLLPAAGKNWWSRMQAMHCGGALLCGWLALGTSLLHLGRPQFAFRAVIGLRHSWLSREIVAFGLFALLATVYAAVGWPPPEGEAHAGRLQQFLGAAVVGSGLVGVISSVMIYHSTRRAFWNVAATGIRFLLTTVILGIASVWLALMTASLLSGAAEPARFAIRQSIPLCRWLIIASVVKLASEASLFRHLWRKQHTPLKRSAMLMTGPLANVVLARFASGFIGGVWMPALLWFGGSLSGGETANEVFLTAAVASLFASCLAGEILERYLFFTAVTAPKMPGGVPG